MTAYTTPWPEGRPPHMILTNSAFGKSYGTKPLENVIKNHLESCDECHAWAEDHGDDPSLWMYPRD